MGLRAQRGGSPPGRKGAVGRGLFILPCCSGKDRRGRPGEGPISPPSQRLGQSLASLGRRACLQALWLSGLEWPGSPGLGAQGGALPVGHSSYPGHPCPSPRGRERQGSQPWSPCPTQAARGSKLRTFEEDFSVGVQEGCSSGDFPPSALWHLGCPRLQSQDLNLANGCHNLALLHQATLQGAKGVISHLFQAVPCLLRSFVLDL